MISLTERIVRFSQFRDAPIPKPRDGHVISGHWRTRVHASRLRETGIAGRSYIADICIVFFVAITSLIVFSYSGIGLLGKYTAL